MAQKIYLEGKLIELLQGLSPREIRRFGEYVASPFYNKNERVIRLANVLRKYHPDYLEIRREWVFKKVFIDKEKYQYNLLRAVISQLSKLLEDFIAYREYEGNKLQKQEHLLFALMKRKLNKHYLLLHNKVMKQQAQGQCRDTDYLQHRLEVRKINNKFVTTNEPRKYNEVFQELLFDFEKLYLANKLKYISIAKIWNRIVKGSFDIWLEEEVLAFVGQKDFDDLPCINIYLGLIKLLENLEDDCFQDFKKELLVNLDHFKVTEQRQLLTALINCANWKKLDGQESYFKEIHELYKVALRRSILFSQGEPISPHHFRNIVKSAVESGNLDWCQKFIQKNEMRLEHKYGESIVLYSLAEINFAKGEIDAAAKVIAEINAEFEQIDFYYQLYYRTLVVKIAFSVEDSDWLFHSLEAFRHFLRRNITTIPEKLNTAYDHFIKVVGKISSSREGKSDCRQHVNSLAPLVEKRWLLKAIAN